MSKKRYKKLSLGDRKTLTNKILFTFLMVALFKLLSYVPAPFVNLNIITDATKQLNILQTSQLFSGNAVTQLTLMATGISSYISASVVLQFLTYSIKKLNEIQKSSNGEKIMKRITLILGSIMSFATSLMYLHVLALQTPNILTNGEWYARLVIAAVHTLGTIIAINIGNAIDKKGYGNGLSLLIAVNVVSSFPSLGLGIFEITKQLPLYGLGIILLTALMMIIIVFMESSEKRLWVSYSKVVSRQRGHMKEQKQTLPMKINNAGVMPIIISASILQLFVFVMGFFTTRFTGAKMTVAELTNPGGLIYGITMSVLIVVFTFIYSAISLDTNELADNLQKNGGTIVGTRPGLDTKNLLRKIHVKLTRISALYLFVVSLIPIVMTGLLGFSGIQATSLMIVVGLAIDAITKLQNEHKLGKMKL